MEIQVIEKTNGRINRVTGTTIKEIWEKSDVKLKKMCKREGNKIIMMKK